MSLQALKQSAGHLIVFLDFRAQNQSRVRPWRIFFLLGGPWKSPTLNRVQIKKNCGIFQSIELRHFLNKLYEGTPDLLGLTLLLYGFWAINNCTGGGIYHPLPYEMHFRGSFVKKVYKNVGGGRLTISKC